MDFKLKYFKISHESHEICQLFQGYLKPFPSLTFVASYSCSLNPLQSAPNPLSGTGSFKSSTPTGLSPQIFSNNPKALSGVMKLSRK